MTPPREPSLKPSARPSARASTRPTSSFDLDEELWFGLSDEVGKEEAKRSLAATVARELGVRAAPTTVAAIGALDLDTAPVDDIIKVFEADPALAARVLSVVNSAGYALSYRCRSIRHAVVMLGVRAVASLATASSFMDFLTHDSEVSEALTAHAHDVAVLSAHLAFLSGESREQAYAIGLLHDIGRSMLLQSEEQRYQPLGALTDESNVAEREREEFGFDHAMLGSTVLRAWQIPRPDPHHRRLPPRAAAPLREGRARGRARVHPAPRRPARPRAAGVPRARPRGRRRGDRRAESRHPRPRREAGERRLDLAPRRRARGAVAGRRAHPHARSRRAEARGRGAAIGHDRRGAGPAPVHQVRAADPR
ncbi:MAG: HDOD domain-containing protein [Myxococcales bacterium]|nr:HDOD domain-containing protein [Myxococcales bacterium]